MDVLLKANDDDEGFSASKPRRKKVVSAHKFILVSIFFFSFSIISSHLIISKIYFQNMERVTDKELFRGGLAKILKEQFPVDVLLKANDNDEVFSASKPGKKKVVSAHKFILSERSEVFKKMLESVEIKTSDQPVTITVSDMNHEELEAFIDFIYSDGSALPAKHARSLYLAAEKYMIPHLRDVCRKELISSLNSSNAIEMLVLAQIPFDKALNDAAFNMIVANMIEVSKSGKFKRFVVNHPDLAVDIIQTFSSLACRSCGKTYYCIKCLILN